ncbi:CotH kinase family protein [Mucilaginibacter pallidiroseus]|uniref:CotH kinase family protein n=1 Tax=Mucilaginibacter pallidiroseus TaxID=2599295 RepID=UPI001645610F|nr:CotH kinase family protein [Mucilaginibacter pallidiroseus]
MKCEVTASSGDIKKYVLIVKVFTGLPILYINTTAPVTSKDNYVKGNVTVDANTGLSTDKASLSTQIKGRGNSTWALFPKKPYRLKLDAKASVLGMPAAKNWVLLANYDDKTLMRNYIALKLARRLGSSYAADCKFVEVVLNGDHIGNYLLTAQVEVHENGVNIAELKPQNTSADDITGGYLLELDTRLDEKYWFKTAKNLPFTIKSPEDITPAQLNYIQTYVQNAENALFSPTFGDPNTGYAKYFDVDSFINWYFTEEVVQNQDGRDYSSMFYYKDRNGKIGMGPVWDFDLSAGNVDYSPAKNPTGIWYIRDATWMMRLAQDPGFITKVRNRWAQIKDREVKQIFTDIDQTAAYLKLSQQKNFTRWPILTKYVWPNAVVLGSYDLEVAYMKDFITQRVGWLNNNMASF